VQADRELRGSGSEWAVDGDSVRDLVWEDPALESRYGEYCRRQAQGLVTLLPHDAIRPLYAKARAWAKGAGLGSGKDPLATLLLYLREILPLPPFELWLTDRSEHLEAHLEEEFTSPPAQRRLPPPVTVASRGVPLGDANWRATLHIFRRNEAWRGFISFRHVGEGAQVRTADIFREEDPEEIRDRFRTLTQPTLQAFLRSVL